LVLCEIQQAWREENFLQNVSLRNRREGETEKNSKWDEDAVMKI